MHERYVKMALGINVNTPSYIWKMEAGRHDMEVEGLKRAGRYLMDIGDMGEERWPKVCLREELRGIKNRFGSKWGDGVVKALSNVGDGESIDMLLVKEDKGRLMGFLKRGVKIKRAGNSKELERDKKIEVQQRLWGMEKGLGQGEILGGEGGDGSNEAAVGEDEVWEHR